MFPHDTLLKDALSKYRKGGLKGATPRECSGMLTSYLLHFTGAELGTPPWFHLSAEKEEPLATYSNAK